MSVQKIDGTIRETAVLSPEICCISTGEKLGLTLNDGTKLEIGLELDEQHQLSAHLDRGRFVKIGDVLVRRDSIRTWECTLKSSAAEQAPSEMTIRALSGDVFTLTGEEAETVYNLLRERD